MVGCVGELEEQKRERFTGQDKDTLIHEGKKGGKKPSDAKASTQHLPPADWCPASLRATASLEGLDRARICT